MEKMPPLAKVFEAWSALADGRVSLDGEDRRATVASSNGAKAYTVTWWMSAAWTQPRQTLPPMKCWTRSRRWT